MNWKWTEMNWTEVANSLYIRSSTTRATANDVFEKLKKKLSCSFIRRGEGDKMAKRTIIDDIEELKITITDIRLNALKIFLIYEKENQRRWLMRSRSSLLNVPLAWLNLFSWAVQTVCT